MPFVERAGRRIHWSVEGSGPGLLLLPGLGAGGQQFGTLPRRFARAGFTCAAVDPIGVPPSGPLAGEWSFADAAADALAVAAALPPPVSLVGTSLGGKVALAAAAAAPASVHRLVMLGSAATRSGHADAIHHWFELLATRVDGDLLPELIAPFLFGATFQQQRPGVVADIVRAMRPTAAGRELMAAQARALQQFDGEALARACPTPTLCLAGSEDLLTLPADVAATAELLPNAHYRCLPAAGHSLLLESAAAFDAVVDFVRGRAS